MLTNAVFLLLIIAMAKCGENRGVGPLNFIYRKFSNCAKKPTRMNISLTSKWINDSYQVLDGNFYTPVDIGDNFQASISAEMLVRKTWVHMADMSDLFCRALRNYLGPLREDLLHAVGLTPDTCPIPQGHYRVRNLHLDFKKCRIPAAPYGILNVTLALYEKPKNILNLCLSMELENTP